MNTGLNCCYCQKPYERVGYLKHHQAICKATHSTNMLSSEDMTIIIRDLLKRVDRLETDNSRLKARLASKRTNPCEWLKYHVRLDTYFVPENWTITVNQDDLMKLLNDDLSQCLKDIIERHPWDYFKCTNRETMKLYRFEKEGWKAIQSTDIHDIAKVILRNLKRVFDEYADEHMDSGEDDRYLDYTEKIYKVKVDKIGTLVKKILCNHCFITTDIEY